MILDCNRVSGKRESFECCKNPDHTRNPNYRRIREEQVEFLEDLVVLEIANESKKLGERILEIGEDLVSLTSPVDQLYLLHNVNNGFLSSVD